MRESCLLAAVFSVAALAATVIAAAVLFWYDALFVEMPTPAEKQVGAAVHDQLPTPPADLPLPQAETELPVPEPSPESQPEPAPRPEPAIAAPEDESPPNAGQEGGRPSFEPPTDTPTKPERKTGKLSRGLFGI